MRAGGPIEMSRPVADWPCLSPPPPNAVYFLKKVTTNRAAFSIPQPIHCPTKHPTVDCGMVDF